jgi:hypothetical protein
MAKAVSGGYEVAAARLKLKDDTKPAASPEAALGGSIRGSKYSNSQFLSNIATQHFYLRPCLYP